MRTSPIICFSISPAQCVACAAVELSPRMKVCMNGSVVISGTAGGRKVKESVAPEKEHTAETTANIAINCIWWTRGPRPQPELPRVR
eukprot:4116716-Prymnesium_polylepis.1